ncbi:MAG: DUF5034 domain-containing protein [Mediterranea sp.]|jgi:hypothetical protein|nr:DUF5034 domain-containing protein [Mediterranea sp.]
MKRPKTFYHLLLAVVFLTTSATHCYEYKEVPAILSDMKLYHWNNAGEKPVAVTDGKVSKETYLLEIRLLARGIDGTTDSYYGYEYLLEDPIRQVQIFALWLPFEGNVDTQPEETDVTASMFDYPYTISSDQLEENTDQGEPIKLISQGTAKIYKALLTPLPAGDYQFRVLLTAESGATMEQLSDTINLY